MLVTELIRLTLRKLQTALDDNRINDDDLVAMATAVDPRALADCLPPDVSRQTSDVQGRGSPAWSSTDRLMTGDHDRPDAVSSREMADVAKKVLSDVMYTLSDHCY